MKTLCIDGDNHDPTEEHVIARPNCRNGSCERVCWAFDGKSSASPDCRIQWDRYKGSPPQTSSASVSSTIGTPTFSLILGSAVSSSTPKDFQPSSHRGLWAFPRIACRASTAGEGIYRGRNEKSTGFGNRFAQQLDQRVVDARVIDASGSEEKLHRALP